MNAKSKALKKKTEGKMAKRLKELQSKDLRVIRHGKDWADVFKPERLGGNGLSVRNYL